MSRVLIVNGALGGATGNTAELLALAEEQFSQWAEVEILDLSRSPSLDRILEAVDRADGFLFGTGTYWDSWSSNLQRFLEETAHTEGSELWRGKPGSAVVTAHAVGAKGVLSRLLGVLNSYGLLIPPFGGLTYTWAADVARRHANAHLASELWSVADVEVVCHNLRQAIVGGSDWRVWPTSEGLGQGKWLRAYTDRTVG